MGGGMGVTVGQTFYACAYDINEKTCCVVEADKFHANCYSHSGVIACMHYLLRQKPYHIIWYGDSIISEGIFSTITDESVLLGISSMGDIGLSEPDVEYADDDTYTANARFIADNCKTWKRIYIWDTAIKYFDMHDNGIVAYAGFLVNHTKRLAVDLCDYFRRSSCKFPHRKFLRRTSISAKNRLISRSNRLVKTSICFSITAMCVAWWVGLFAGALYIATLSCDFVASCYACNYITRRFGGQDFGGTSTSDSSVAIVVAEMGRA